jgi:xanthine phosphoribosyltransferase
MKALEEKILREGTVLEGHILKVGSFLNQQLDVDFLMEMGEEIKKIYSDTKVTKLLTIESSGIAVAVAAGAVMHVPVVFAKKNKSANVSGDVFSTVVHSYTHNTDYTVVVAKDYLKPEDKIVIIDDFLANGKALEGLIDIVKQSGAELIGATCAIEKGFQKGGDSLREQGYRIESLAIIDEMSPSAIEFRELN